MINVNGSGIFNQQTQISEQSKTPVSQSQSSGAASPQQAVSQAVHDLRSLMAGDAFTGQVASLDGSSVTLTLPNGSQINATLQNQVNLIKGQNLTFLVADNNGTTITLKPMQFLDEQTSYVAGKALEAAGLASTPANEEIVHELLGQNMSISAQTLNDMAKAAAKYPDAGIDTLTRLYKLDIPITQENIQQFEAYKSYENRISGEILDLSSGLSDMISNALLENGQSGAAELSKDILNILYGSENLSETISKFLDETARDNLKAMLSKAFPDGVSENLQKKIADGSIPARELLDSFNQLMTSEKAEPKALAQFFKSDEFKGLMEMIMRDTMHLSPKDVKEKDAVKDFYEKVRNDVDKLSKLVDDKSGNNSPLAKSLGNVRENIEFMNELNKNMTFFQMPIKFSENNANGELYVFTNKKSLKQNKDDISALLHLDMENLGPMDIFVKLKGKNVSTNFCLENEEMLDFIYSHIDRLNERLEKLGFNCKFEMKVKEDSQKQFDFVQDFIDADLPKVHSTTQFVFDRKA